MACRRPDSADSGGAAVQRRRQGRPPRPAPEARRAVSPAAVSAGTSRRRSRRRSPPAAASFPRDRPLPPGRARSRCRRHAESRVREVHAVPGEARREVRCGGCRRGGVQEGERGVREAPSGNRRGATDNDNHRLVADDLQLRPQPGSERGSPGAVSRSSAWGPCRRRRVETPSPALNPARLLAIGFGLALLGGPVARRAGDVRRGAGLL